MLPYVPFLPAIIPTQKNDIETQNKNVISDINYVDGNGLGFGDAQKINGGLVTWGVDNRNIDYEYNPRVTNTYSYNDNDTDSRTYNDNDTITHVITNTYVMNFGAGSISDAGNPNPAATPTPTTTNATTQTPTVKTPLTVDSSGKQGGDEAGGLLENIAGQLTPIAVIAGIGLLGYAGINALAGSDTKKKSKKEK